MPGKRTPEGYTAVKHQQEAGTGYFDQVLNVIIEGTGSTSALKGSTEHDQLHDTLHTH